MGKWKSSLHLGRYSGSDSVGRRWRASNMKKWKSELVLMVLLLPGSFASRLAAQIPTPADAIALEKQGKLPEAATAWRAVTAHNPKDAAAFASLGLVLSKQEQYPEAATCYKKALALNPR